MLHRRLHVTTRRHLDNSAHSCLKRAINQLNGSLSLLLIAASLWQTYVVLLYNATKVGMLKEVQKFEHWF